MGTLQRYELIRPILNREKTPKVVHQETGIPLSTIYWVLSRFLLGGIKGLANKSHAIPSHPKWLTEKDKDKVVHFKKSEWIPSYNSPFLQGNQKSNVKSIPSYNSWMTKIR